MVQKHEASEWVGSLAGGEDHGCGVVAAGEQRGKRRTGREEGQGSGGRAQIRHSKRMGMGGHQKPSDQGDVSGQGRAHKRIKEGMQ
jgi:hypothetical protein